MRNSAGRLTLTGCTMSGNRASFGGGIYSDNAGDVDEPLTLVNCVLNFNSASVRGGAILLRASFPAVANCTFVSNSAGNGPALAFDGAPSTLLMDNCILRDGGDEVWNDNASTTAIRYSNVEGGFGGIGNIDADPMFVDTLIGDYRLSTIAIPPSAGMKPTASMAVAVGWLSSAAAAPR